MKKFLAIVGTNAPVLPTSGEHIEINQVQLITQIDASTFYENWNEGIVARQQWEQFCENLFQILIKTGLIDENGLHTSEYTPGSICRFLMANKEMFPQEFRDGALGMMVMSAIKTGAKTIKKGKDIEVDWSSITTHAAPMTEAVLAQIIKSPERSGMLMPIIRQYFPVILTETPEDEQPAIPPMSDN